MELAQILALDQRAADVFEALPPGDQTLYGGCSAALALGAAARTIPEGLAPKSLHAAFLSAGRWGLPTTLDVTRLSDGRSFASRQVSVRQGDRLVASVMASFHVPAEGSDWQAAVPDGLPSIEEATSTALALPEPCVELRCIGVPPATPIGGSTHPYWARPTVPVGDDAVAQAVAVAFISDYLVVFAMHRGGVDLGEAPMIRTLTHDLWFHRAPAVDDWLLFDAEPLSMSEGRGLLRGSITRPDGALAASFAQEVVVPG